MIVKPKKKYPWYIRPFFWLQKRKYGKALISAKIWARSPRIFFGLSFFWGAIDRKSSPLDKKLRTLVCLYLSEVNHCKFCVSLHGSILKSDKIKSTLPDFQESPLFTEKEKIALTFAEKINSQDVIVPNALKKELKKSFSDDEIVELAGLISFQILSNKFNLALDIPSQNF